MLPPAARSPPGRSLGNPWSPAAPAREKSSVGALFQSGAEGTAGSGSKQDLWEAFSDPWCSLSSHTRWKLTRTELLTTGLGKTASLGKEQILAWFAFLNEVAGPWPLSAPCSSPGACRLMLTPSQQARPAVGLKLAMMRKQLCALFLHDGNISTKGYETSDYLSSSNCSVINTHSSILKKVFWPWRKMCLETVKTLFQQQLSSVKIPLILFEINTLWK